jgi:hypothetical protein
MHAIPSKLDVMQPIRALLGMGVAQAISLGGTTLVVEGVTDALILEAMSSYCCRAGMACLPEDVTIFPSGGSGRKMMPFISLLAGEGVTGAVLLDCDKAGSDAAKLVYDTYGDLLAVIRTHDPIVAGREIEDLLGGDFYRELVNTAHSQVEGFRPLRKSDLKSDQPLVDQVSSHFKQLKMGAFQKVFPAKELQQRAELGSEQPAEVVLNSFALLFETITQALRVVDSSGVAVVHGEAD